MLTTSQIEAQCANAAYFIGVFPADRLPRVTSVPATLIVNTDPSDSPGEHWIAIHVRTGKRVDYFDSFGFPPLIPSIQQFIRENGCHGKRYNQRTIQAFASSLCGDFCICYIKCVAKGIELPEFIARFASVVFDDKQNYKRGMICMSKLSC